MILVLIKKCGGETSVLNNKLPMELKYIFENQYIECIKILIVLYIHKRRKNGLSIDGLVYYLTLEKCCDRSPDDEDTVGFDFIQNIYFKNEKSITKNITILVNKQLICVNYQKKNNELQLKITSKGIEMIESLESEYFAEKVIMYSYLVKNMKYTNNKKGVLFIHEG